MRTALVHLLALTLATAVYAACSCITPVGHATGSATGPATDSSISRSSSPELNNANTQNAPVSVNVGSPASQETHQTP